MWPSNSIKSIKSGLVRGSIPCGCAFNPKWNENQTRIRVQRECKKRGYVFNGWVGDYKGAHTRLNLYNPKTDNKWESLSVPRLFRGSGDPTQRNDRISQSSLISDEIHINSFTKTKSFKKGTKFWRSNKANHQGSKSYWYYSCPVCSNDKYVKNKVCTGVFEGDISNLKNGSLSCRCSSKYRWSKEQREYQIREVCEGEGLVFIGWGSGGYRNNLSTLGWLCDKGHTNLTKVCSFINESTRCRICTKLSRSLGNGFYPDRTEEDDTLYLLILGSNKCIKVGRTFVSSKTDRLRRIEKDSGMSVEKVLTLHGKHKDIYDLEQIILNSASVTRYESQYFTGSSELLNYSDLKGVCEMLEETCKKDTRFTLKCE